VDAARALVQDIRDIDLVEKVTAAHGTGGYTFIHKSCVAEQQRRDQLNALPRDRRRRAVTKNMLSEKGAADRDSLRHIHSVLAMCALPYVKQPIENREWESKQGKMSLMVTAGKLASPEGKWIEQPLPYGSRARLLMLHTCSEAIRQKSPTIEIESSLTGFIRSMGFTVTGGKNGTLQSFKNQINALAACTMRIGMWDGAGKARTVTAQPFSAIDVWFPNNPDQQLLWPSTLTFSQDFYNTLTKHALPVNIHAVKAFAGSPRKLDMLFWLGYRLASLNRSLTISWDALQEQWGAGYSRPSNFRRDFAEEIRQIKEVFPKLPVQVTENGFVISPGSTEVLAIPAKP